MANVKVATPLTLSWAAECMLKANLCLCRPRRAETEGWGEPGAAGSSGQTFRCSPWDGPSRTCASEKPRQWFAPERKKKTPKKEKYMTFSFKNTTRGNFRVKTRTPPSPFHGSWDPGARADTETASKDVWRWALSVSSCPNTPETETQVTVNRTLTTIQQTQQSIDVYNMVHHLAWCCFLRF